MILLKWLSIVMVCSFSILQIEGCVAFQLKMQDETAVYCRSIASDELLGSNLLVVPRGVEFVGTAPNELPGLQWKVKYGYVGMNQSSNRMMVYDGMNEKGLIVSALFFLDYQEYEKYELVTLYKTLNHLELVSYLLGTCSDVEEARHALANCLIVQDLKIKTPPLHYYLTDSSGVTVVIEYSKGKRKEYDNPLRVLANSPPFDWQLVNLAYFENSGDKGIQKDFLDQSSPSHFIKAARYSQIAPLTTPEDSVRMGFYLLNLFEFPGIAPPLKKDNSRPNFSPNRREGISGVSEWMIVHDSRRLRTYFRGHLSLGVQMVDLRKTDFNQSRVREVRMRKTFAFENDTYKGRDL